MIAIFIVNYMFDVGEFLAQEMRDRAVGGENFLLAYPCMIMQISIAEGVQELSSIDEMIEAMNTSKFVLIRDASNPIARQGTDVLTEISRQRSQTEIIEATETGGQTDTTSNSDVVGISSSLPIV